MREFPLLMNSNLYSLHSNLFGKIMTREPIISPTKADRLYWLGRYTERAYFNLHLMRRYYDMMIDGQAEDYKEYFENLGGQIEYPDKKFAILGYMYDAENPNSILNGIERANDNAIVLREEITSESLAFIQMSLVKINKEAQRQDSNITNLQPITDWLLAFWGSIEERMLDHRAKSIIKTGKVIEQIDMKLRFGYPFFKLKESIESLFELADNEPGIFDQDVLEDLSCLLVETKYDPEDAGYRNQVLGYIAKIVLI